MCGQTDRLPNMASIRSCFAEEDEEDKEQYVGVGVTRLPTGRRALSALYISRCPVSPPVLPQVTADIKDIGWALTFACCRLNAGTKMKDF